MSVYGRYETATRKRKDDDGNETYLTRRQYNESFQKFDNPVPEIPESGQYLWDWFFDADARVSRIDDGTCRMIPPTEWIAWQRLHGEIIYHWEYGTLAAMDRAYCAAVNEEIAAGRAMEKQG